MTAATGFLRRGSTWLAAALLVASCSDDPAPPRRVCLLVLDSLHAAHLGSYGDRAGLTPNLDRLAARGTRFESALSNNTWTLASTATLFTGLLQERHGVVTAEQALGGEPLVLPELFRAEGYRTAAFVQMAYASQTYGFDRGFDEFHYYGFAGGPRRDAMPDDVQRFLAARADERWFLYLHLRRPHGVYNPFPGLLACTERACPLADGRRDEELARADTFGERELEPAERAHVRHLYRANLATVDLRLGPLLDRLERDAGALVVLTSDHGEGLGEHGFYGHGRRLYPETVRIPLVFAGAGVARGTVPSRASTVDLLPTLAELCDLGRAAGLAGDGASLVPLLRGGEPPETPRRVFFSGRYPPRGRAEVGVAEGQLEVVVESRGGVRVHDPAGAGDEAVERLTRLARELRRERSTPAATPVEVPEGVRDDLDALGYGGDS